MRTLFLAGAVAAALLAASFTPWGRTPDDTLATLSPTEMTIAGGAVPAGASYDSF